MRRGDTVFVASAYRLDPRWDAVGTVLAATDNHSHALVRLDKNEDDTPTNVIHLIHRQFLIRG